ncbi:hypothetical protein INT46_001800 [Mucor plumbeus]|uniref:Uncharacterized protein n=1 Tax=Mucor plumbeus TaxID=97098 RepID=A0A8H7QLI6_9FUNG|nr:hypothetical protein INT46_001800 [Mucor plumbeus]
MTDNNDKSRIPENCRLYEMVQYQCEATRHNIECSPFVRLFLRCTGLPTVEVTPEYDQYGDPISRIPSTKTPAIKGEEILSTEN